MIVYVIIPRGFFSKNNHPLGKNVHFSRAGSEGPKKNMVTEIFGKIRIYCIMVRSGFFTFFRK